VFGILIYFWIVITEHSNCSSKTLSVPVAYKLAVYLLQAAKHVMFARDPHFGHSTRAHFYYSYIATSIVGKLAHLAMETEASCH